MAKYRKKPVEVEAIELGTSDASIKAVMEFIEGKKVDSSSCAMASDRFGQYCDIVRKEGLNVETMEGSETAIPGEYFIIKGIQGEFYPCQKDIFHKTYEGVDE